MQIWRSGASLQVAIIRRLQEVLSDHENDMVITEFGHIRPACVIRTSVFNNAHLDVFLRDMIQRRVEIVPDMYSLARRHGFDVDLATLPDNETERRQARFFLLQGVQLTSAKSATV